MSPVLTLVGMDIGLALGIALYVESVYRLPGLGLSTLRRAERRHGLRSPDDSRVVLVIGLVIVVANFTIDLIVAWMDPRAAEAGTRLRRRPRRLRGISSGVRILLVSQMYPGPETPDLGSFVATLEHALEARGHELERAVVDRPGGRGRYARLALDVLGPRTRFVPTSSTHTSSSRPACSRRSPGRAPLVVTAHGQDVENARRTGRSGWRPATVGAPAVIAVSSWLLDRLVEVVPEALAKSSVIDCGVDLERFSLRDATDARAEVGWAPDGTGFLCVGSLTERKNVLRLARAFEQRGEGELAFVGDGPLRGALEGRPGIHARRNGRARSGRGLVRGRRRGLPAEPAEPFGLSTLEGARVGPVGRRDQHRRAAGVRAAGGGRPRRPEGRRRRRAPASKRPRRSHDRTSRRGAPPRRTTSGCRRSGWRSFWFVPQLSRSASLSSTSGRTVSSSPAARAASSAAL